MSTNPEQIKLERHRREIEEESRRSREAAEESARIASEIANEQRNHNEKQSFIAEQQLFRTTVLAAINTTSNKKSYIIKKIFERINETKNGFSKANEIDFYDSIGVFKILNEHIIIAKEKIEFKEFEKSSAIFSNICKEQCVNLALNYGSPTYDLAVGKSELISTYKDYNKKYVDPFINKTKIEFKIYSAIMLIIVLYFVITTISNAVNGGFSFIGFAIFASIIYWLTNKFVIKRNEIIKHNKYIKKKKDSIYNFVETQIKHLLEQCKKDSRYEFILKSSKSDLARKYFDRFIINKIEDEQNFIPEDIRPTNEEWFKYFLDDILLNDIDSMVVEIDNFIKNSIIFEKNNDGVISMYYIKRTSKPYSSVDESNKRRFSDNLLVKFSCNHRYLYQLNLDDDNPFAYSAFR